MDCAINIAVFTISGRKRIRMKAIIGLGNPGMKYAGTRHNIGFDAVTAIADKYNFKINNKRFKGLYADGFIGGEKVLLIQP